MTHNATVNGVAEVSGLSVTFSNVLAVMTVTYQFTDIGGTTRTMTSLVHVAGTLKQESLGQISIIL